MMTVVALRSLSAETAAASAASPSASRFAFGSSRTTRIGSRKQRARQSEPLPLAGGQKGAALADLRGVAVRKAADHFVGPGGFRRRDDRLVRRIVLKAGDVLGRRA